MPDWIYRTIAEGNLMRIKYVGSQNFILVLVLWLLLSWVFGASAAEKWNAKTTARVNLRRNPSSNGVILSIVPKGHSVRIMERQGLWCKIDVEGDIHGRGWVFADYLEEILTKVPAAEANSQTAAVELPSEKRIERIHPANLLPSARTPAEKQTPLHTPPPEETSRDHVRVQPSIDDEFSSGRDKSGSLSRMKIPADGEPLDTRPVPGSHEVRAEDEKEKPFTESQPEKFPLTGNKHHLWTQNEWQDMQPKSTAGSPLESPIIGKPIYVTPVQPLQCGIESHPSGVIRKAFSEVPVQGDSIARPADLPIEVKEPATTAQRKPLEVKERAVPNTPAVEETAKHGMAVSYKRRAMVNKESMGLVELVLKLISIALTALVILFLHRANKIATNRYKALIQFQNRLNSRQ
jgi:hypothetical protein